MNTILNQKLLNDIREARNIGYETGQASDHARHTRRTTDRRVKKRRIGQEKFEIKNRSGRFTKHEKFIFVVIATALVSCVFTVLYNI